MSKNSWEKMPIILITNLQKNSVQILINLKLQHQEYLDELSLTENTENSF